MDSQHLETQAAVQNRMWHIFSVCLLFISGHWAPHSKNAWDEIWWPKNVLVFSQADIIIEASLRARMCASQAPFPIVFTYLNFVKDFGGDKKSQKGKFILE